MLRDSRQRLHQFETNKEWEQVYKTAKYRAMLHWPSWEEFANESYCNFEGAFTTLEPFTRYEAEQRCVSFTELEQIIEKAKLAAEKELKR